MFLTPEGILVTLSRRTALQIGGLGVIGAAASIAPLRLAEAGTASALLPKNTPKPYRVPLPIPKVLPTVRAIDSDGVLSHTALIRQVAGSAGILPGVSTPVLAYNGQFPGPTISVEQGEALSLRMENRMPFFHPKLGYVLRSSTHLHGAASLPQYDGYASDLTGMNQYKTYQYENIHQARTIWYHDHAAHITSQNVYSGLFAQYHIHDPTERALLPQGDYDVPLSVSDAAFERDGSFLFNNRSTSGLWGDVILVNGAPWPVMPVEPRIYRFRLLNSSISRSYRFSLSSGDPVTIVATDSGLVPKAIPVMSWRQAPAERYEFLIDFSKHRGRRIELKNLSNRNNVDYANTNRVMAFDVLDVTPNLSGPASVSMPTLLAESDAMTWSESDAVKKRKIRVKREGGLWTVGGLTWDDVERSEYQKVLADPDLDDVEIWEFENTSSGWFHPMHIHLVDVRILSRNGKPPFPYEVGPKDVVYVGEGETVRVLTKFEHHRGRYMVHCHNLPHEDHDMMAQFSVGYKAGDPDPNDPIDAAPALPL